METRTEVHKKKCLVLKDSTDFALRSRNPIRYRSVCKACWNEYMNQWYHEHSAVHIVRAERWKSRRRAMCLEITNRAKSAPCTDCGQTYHPFVMDFDHVRGNKIEDISVLCHMGVPEKDLLAEIAKCDVVCANCHRMRTLNRRLQRMAL